MESDLSFEALLDICGALFPFVQLLSVPSLVAALNHREFDESGYPFRES
jgi:hypothetical protein